MGSTWEGGRVVFIVCICLIGGRAVWGGGGRGGGEVLRCWKLELFEWVELLGLEDEDARTRAVGLLVRWSREGTWYCVQVVMVLLHVLKGMGRVGVHNLGMSILLTAHTRVLWCVYCV